MLTDDEIRKAAESAAEQMWPEAGYVGWTDEDAEFHRLFLEACIAKLTAGVELPESKYAATGDITDMNNFTRDQLLQYGAAQRLAAREQQWLPIESAPQGTMILCANMKAREAKGWCFVAWVVDGKVCGHRMDMPTHWQPLPPTPTSPQEQT